MRQQFFYCFRKLRSILFRKVCFFGCCNRKHAAVSSCFLIGFFIVGNIALETFSTPEHDFSSALIYGSNDLRIAPLCDLRQGAVGVFSDVQQNIGECGFVGVSGGMSPLDDGRQMGSNKVSDQRSGNAEQPAVSRSEVDPDDVHPAIKLLFFITFDGLLFSVGYAVGHVAGYDKGRRSKP